MTKTPSGTKKAAKTTDTAMTPPAPMTPAAPMAAQEPSRTKTAMLRARLAEPGGVSSATLIALTGWQAHTLRAALSSLRKTGLTINRRQESGETFYSIETGAIEMAEGGAAILAGETAEESATALAESDHPVEGDGDSVAQPPLAPLPTEQFASGDQP